MGLRFLAICICLIILPPEIQMVVAQQAMIRSFTVSDGLVMNRVRGFHQDAAGFIWIYTWDGLSRYEGTRFRNYITGRELNHGLANDMFESPDGSIYVAFNDGTVEVIRDLEVQTGERTNGPVINSFFRDHQGQSFAATDNMGICTFDKGITKPFSTNPGFGLMEVLSINTGSHENTEAFLYVGGYRQSSGIVDKQMQFIKKWDEPFFECIYRDLDGRLLAGTTEGMKSLNMNGGMNSLQEPDFIPVDAPWKNWRVFAIVQSHNGIYLIGTNNGLIRLSPDMSWTLLTKEDGLPSNAISSLMIDRSNTLWIGTDVGAASLNLTNTISRFSTPNGKDAEFFLPQAGGFMYFISGNEDIYGINPMGKVVSETHVEVVADHPLRMHNLNGQVLRIRKSGCDILPSLNPNEKLLSGTPMSVGGVAEWNNRIYVAVADELRCCLAGRSSELITDFPYRVESMAKLQENKLLLGTWSNGLFLATAYDSSQSCALHIEKDLTRWLPGKEIRSLMFTGNNDIWIGTRHSGLVRLRCDSTYDTCEAKMYNMTTGLMSNWISSMAEDRSGNIWIGSTSGIDKLIPQKDGYRVFSYSRVFGFYGHIIHIAISTDNSIWCGTSEGYARIIDGMQDTIAPSPVYITEANLGGIKRQPDKHAKRIVLPYNNNSANFTFAAPDYTNAKQQSFTYRLVGSQDTLWSIPDNHQQIFYGNLRPGSYMFEVSAIGLNGERGKSISYPFIIKPPFWRQFWFAGLVICIMMILLYILHRFRIAQIQRIQMVRDRIASDLHDEIGSTLTHVNILSEFGLQSVNETGRPAAIFEKIGSQMQSSADALDDIIWSVKKRHDAIDDLIPRMRQYATELFETSGISFEIVEEIYPNQQLDMELRRDLYLAYKELLRNIVRHSEATKVEIHMSMDHKFIKLMISDNGKGFDMLAPTKRNGLNNIRKRVSHWKGKVEWMSHPGSGTVVKLEMKFN